MDIEHTGWFMSHTVTLKPVFSAMIAIVGPPTYPAPMQQIEPLNAMWQSLMNLMVAMSAGSTYLF